MKTRIIDIRLLQDNSLLELGGVAQLVRAEES